MATKQPQKLKTSFHVDFNFISPPSFLSSQNKRQTKLQQKNSICSITPKATEEFTPFRVSHTTFNRYCGKTSQENLFVLEGILTNNRQITLKLGSCSVLRNSLNFALIRFPLTQSKTGVQKFWHIMHAHRPAGAIVLVGKAARWALLQPAKLCLARAWPCLWLLPFAIVSRQGC